MKGEFFPELESMRGVAALSIVAFHAGQFPYNAAGKAIYVVLEAGDPNPFWNAVSHGLLYLVGGNHSNLHPAVVFFFVLSGFVLAGMLERDGSPWRFAISRLFRLYPAVWICVLGFWLVGVLFGLKLNTDLKYTADLVVANLALWRVQMNGVMWTLQNEILAIPVIYIGSLIAKRLGTVALVVLTVFLMLLSPWDPWKPLLGILGWAPYMGWMWMFLAGMCFYYAGARIAAGLRPGDAGALFIGALVAFFFCTVWIHVKSPVRQMVEVAAAGTMISLMAFGAKGVVNKVLTAPVLRFYGRISYSLYLWHAITLTVLWHQPRFFGAAIAGGVPPSAMALFSALVAIGVTTPLAWLSFRFVERPGIKLGRMLLSRSAPAPAAGAAE